MKRFSIAIKHLDNYVHWFDFVDRIGKNIKQEAAKKETETSIIKEQNTI